MKKRIINLIKVIKLLKWFFLIMAIALIWMLCVANIEDPYYREKFIKNSTLIVKYEYAGLTVSEYFLEVRIPSGISDMRKWGYFLVYEVKQDTNLGNSTLIFDNFFYIRWLTNMFHQTTKLSDSNFNERFFLFSQKPELINRLFNQNAIDYFLKLSNKKVIVPAPMIHTFVTKGNTIQIRIYLLRNMDRLDMDYILKNYNLSQQDKFEIVKLLTNMAANINNQSPPLLDATMVVTHIR